ncbi:hypothetical protein AOLI_G00322750 [Acnodon oligacanthus]
MTGHTSVTHSAPSTCCDSDFSKSGRPGGNLLRPKVTAAVNRSLPSVAPDSVSGALRLTKGFVRPVPGHVPRVGLGPRRTKPTRMNAAFPPPLLDLYEKAALEHRTRPNDCSRWPRPTSFASA